MEAVEAGSLSIMVSVSRRLQSYSRLEEMYQLDYERTSQIVERGGQSGEGEGEERESRILTNHSSTPVILLDPWI